MVAANAAVPPLLAGPDPVLLQPPVNVVRLSLHPGGVLCCFSTLTVFGSPNDVTRQEPAVESFFPADDATAGALRAGA